MRISQQQQQQQHQKNKQKTDEPNKRKLATGIHVQLGCTERVMESRLNPVVNNSSK